MEDLSQKSNYKFVGLFKFIHSFHTFSSIIQNQWYELTKKHYDMLILFTFKNKFILKSYQIIHIRICTHTRSTQYYLRYLIYVKKFE